MALKIRHYTFVYYTHRYFYTESLKANLNKKKNSLMTSIIGFLIAFKQTPPNLLLIILMGRKILCCWLGIILFFFLLQNLSYWKWIINLISTQVWMRFNKIFLFLPTDFTAKTIKPINQKFNKVFQLKTCFHFFFSKNRYHNNNEINKNRTINNQ